MESKSPKDAVKSAFSQFGADVAGYPYAKIWCLLWVVFGIIALIGGIMLAKDTRGNHTPSYHLAVKNEKQIQIPSLRFDIVSGTSAAFTTTSCTTQRGNVIQLISCGPKCVETDPAVHVSATPTDNRVACVLKGSDQDTNFMVKVSSPQNPDYHIFDTYIKSTDAASVYVDRVVFNSHKSTSVSYSMTSEYNTAASTAGTVNLYIISTTFDTFSWVQWNPFSGWNCFGTIGGLFFFIYILHCLVMMVVSLFLENPWANNNNSRASGESKPLFTNSQGYQELRGKSSSDVAQDI